jgi:hypothetical protein
LGTVKPELAGVSFQVQVQNFVDPSGTLTKGAYRLRSPRIVTTQTTPSIYVKDIKILLNGVFDSVNNAYSAVDRTVPFIKAGDGRYQTPVLSGDMMVVLKNGLDAPKFTVSFVDIGVRADAPVCINEAGFSNVKTLLTNAGLRCAECHNRDATSAGARTLDCGASTTQMCQMASALIDPYSTLDSPLLLVPARGIFEHPQMTDDQRSNFFNVIRAWVNK